MGELSPELRQLARQLANGPAFLLLGQNGLADNAPESRAFQWSGVYTSSTSSHIASMFQSTTRTATSLIAVTRVPSRSKTELEIRYLFGADHLPESERPPVTAVDLVNARFKSNQELIRLTSETVTPRGILLIEGWAPGDLLEPNDLVPALGSLATGQAHLFSVGEWINDPLVKSFADAGQIILHPHSLESALEELFSAGAVKSGSGTTSSRHVIPVGDGFVDIDIHTWNQIRKSARPIDLELLTPPVNVSKAARYQEFRNFMGTTESVPGWKGLASGMNLVRDFETKLVERVHMELNDRDLPSPIILVGQTTTGKSVALASLGIKLAREGQVAVLHQSRRSVRPSIDDIEMYSAWVESEGAYATVLIWDGMVDPSEYEAFARQLHARGRKVLLIGSTYKKKDLKGDQSFLLETPAELSQSEISRLGALLGEYGIKVDSSIKNLKADFLSILYRTLPETENKLRSGLASEMRAAEKSMAALARARERTADQGQRISTMQAALLAAGIELGELLPPEFSETNVRELSFAERPPMQRVTTLILVTGSLSIPVPIDLALRMLGREGYQSVRDALGASDIIREISDDNGGIYLSSRSRLEAELLAQHEIPVNVQIDVIINAIRNVRISEGFVGGPDEVEFLVKLLERIGPSSDDSIRYKSYYGEIADALRSRRHETNANHPRLILQESNFIRNFVYWQNEAGKGSVQDRVLSLELNRDLLEEVLADHSVRGLIRLSLAVELASTLGAIIHEYARDPEHRIVHGLTGRLDDVLNAVLQARSIDPGNTYPVDVLAWSTRDAIESGSLSPAERADRLASAIATLKSLDLSVLNGKQLANVDKRGMELNLLLKNDDGVWEYLQKLEANASPAATYFLAQFDADGGAAGEAKALHRLQTALPEVRADWRCAQLLINLTWKSVTDSRLLIGERVPIHMGKQAIESLAQLMADLGDAELPDKYRHLFVKAMMEFSRRNYSDSVRLFREVGDLTRQLSKRIYTAYTLADENLLPIVFTGRVENSDSKSGTVWVNELATRVRFEPRLFTASGEFARNQQLPAFHIGFKLSRGPVAEPRSVFKTKRRI